MEDVENVL
jgi:hypothetical protein